MKHLAHLLVLAALVFATSVQAQTEPVNNEGHFYLGFGPSALALDNDRVPGVKTSSPPHSSKLISVLGGYQFDEFWALDFRFGTEYDNVDVDVLSVNGYRFFGTGKWRPFMSAGLSSFSLDERATDDSTQQGQIGFGLSGNLSRNLELRLGYQGYFALGGDSYQDNEYSAVLAWHFRKPVPVPVAAPTPAPTPVAPPPKKVIKTYELKVLFDFDKSNIKSAYEPQFQEIAQVLKDNPDISLVVEGHTCWIGTEKYNQGLSERRANAVKQKFVQDYGIAANRIETHGYGESRPVADNKTLEGRRKNRRSIAITMGPENVSK
jgi:OOP family OmpA-OmpF porin